MVSIIEGRYYKTRDGRKVGPARREREWFDLNGWGYYPDGRRMATTPGDDDLVDEWQEGPVITETVKRIVPGVYGRVVISPHAETSVTHVGVTFEPIIGDEYAALSAPELRAAAAVLTQLADALEDK